MSPCLWICIKTKFYNICLICAHFLIKDKADAYNGCLLSKAGWKLYKNTLHRMSKTFLRNLMRRLCAIISQFLLLNSSAIHANTSLKGIKLIDFGAERNMAVHGIRFKHLHIQKSIWLFPHRLMTNHIFCCDRWKAGFQCLRCAHIRRSR